MVSFKLGQLQKSIELDIKNINENYKRLPETDQKRADYLTKV
jgi:hypothetical protein